MDTQKKDLRYSKNRDVFARLLVNIFVQLKMGGAFSTHGKDEKRVQNSDRKT
jgi:hypothetical protein